MDLQDLTDDQLRELRSSTKQQIAEFNNKQMAMKILLNSGYGALSNEFFRWYSDDLAESITLSGQLTIRWVERALNAYLNRKFNTEGVDYVIACDTDSAYIDVSSFVSSFVKETGNPLDKKEVLRVLEAAVPEIEGEIEACFQQLYHTTNAHQQALHMKLEAIGTAVWVAKKRYVMSVMSNEGVHYDPPKIKMQGIDAVRSSTPMICRGYIKKAIPLIIEGDEEALRQFMDGCWQEFIQQPFERVAFPRTASNLEKYYDPQSGYVKGTPIHVRGALLYNKMIRDRGLENELEPIRSGGKLRFCYMKVPNPLMENVFAVSDVMSPLLEMDSYIDYEQQYDKSFLDPLQHIIKAAGITIDDNIDISQFMCGPNEGYNRFREYEEEIEEDEAGNG